MFHLHFFSPGIAVSFLFLGIFEISLRIRKERVSWFHRMIILLTGLYLTGVFSITVSSAYAFSAPVLGKDVNLIPFKVLHTMSGNPLNFWGNIILFIPIGVFLVLLSNKCQNLFATLLIGAELSVFIELLQLLNVRNTDIDDVILNTAGTLCGFLIGKFILFSVSSLREKVGIMKKEGDKSYRKQKDTGSIRILAILVFAAVFITGFPEAQGNPGLPPIPEGPLPALEQRPETYASSMISVDIDARNAFLMDVGSNTVLYKKNSDERIAPASTTKLLTALTALDYCDEDDGVLAGDEIHLIAADASRAWLYSGDRLTVRQLLDALLLPSGNDAAYVLAVYSGRRISGDESLSAEEATEVFAEAMNKKAAELGAVHSNFISPDGYDKDGQYTTAHDLALIAKGFLDSDILCDIAGSYKITDRWLSGKRVTYYNTNELINPESQYYDKRVTGLKTGKSEAAGCCLVSSASIGDELYLCVVMDSTEEGRWTDSLVLYDAIE